MEYEAKYGDTGAKLTLNRFPSGSAYSGTANFSKSIHEISYAIKEFWPKEEILNRMKQSEEGIELLLTRIKPDWKQKREVLQCILDLEKQVKDSK